jgi:hypothetical protein
MEQLVELPECCLGIGAFEIVVGAEETLASGLAPAAGDGAASEVVVGAPSTWWTRVLAATDRDE